MTATTRLIALVVIVGASFFPIRFSVASDSTTQFLTLGPVTAVAGGDVPPLMNTDGTMTIPFTGTYVGAGACVTTASPMGIWSTTPGVANNGVCYYAKTQAKFDAATKAFYIRMFYKANYVMWSSYGATDCNTLPVTQSGTVADTGWRKMPSFLVGCTPSTTIINSLCMRVVTTDQNTMSTEGTYCGQDVYGSRVCAQGSAAWTPNYTNKDSAAFPFTCAN